jgi:hypothetical protein
MPRLLELLLGSALIAGCGQRDSSGTAAEVRALENAERIAREAARLDTWLDARYEEQLDWSPILKTMLGRKDDYAELDDLSESAHDAQLEWQRRSVEDLQRGFDYALLTPEAKTSVELWTYALEQAEAALPFRRRAYLFEQMSGAHTDLPHLSVLNTRPR